MPVHPINAPIPRRKFLKAASLAIGVGIVPSGIASAASADGALDLTAYRGVVVYLDFWASWCAPCKLSFRFLEDLRARYQDRDLAIITVNVDRDRSAAQAFIRDNRARLPVVYDPDGKLASRFKVATMPTSFVIDRSGQTRFVHRGYFDNKSGEYDEHVAALVDQHS